MKLKFTFSLLILSILLLSGQSFAEAEESVKDVQGEPITPKPRVQRKTAQKFEFQAEVNRLMDILINSLYSNKDIFLRELISNSADALDKIRFISLTDKKQLESNSRLEVQLKVDKNNSMLSIRDTGIGMTKQDLIQNLGTIAKSGTSAFIEQFKKSQDLKLIGQFGVGFYSVFLVADYVEVITKNNADKQYIWESAADGNFAISEDTENESLGRGTQINIHIKPDSQTYLDEGILRRLVYQYSEFIDFPISLWVEKEVEEEVQSDEEDKESSLEDDLKDDKKDQEKDTDDKEAEDEEAEDEPTEEDKKSKTEKVKRKVAEWEQLNVNKAIWIRDPKEVTDAQYNEFYKSITKENVDPILHNHFKAEGDVEFRALLYIPRQPPRGYYDNYYNNPASLRLYVRRVFITDQLDKLLPRYLRFVRGVLDSDTLPINVSRETLQQLGALKTIGKKLVRKILDSIRKLAQGPTDTEDDDLDLDEKKDEGEDKKSKKEQKEEDAKKAVKKYDQFYVEYARSIKLGVIEDSTNRQKLTKLLRFFSTASPGNHMSLDDYISRMKPEQKSIYYLTGQNREEVINSPFLEKLTRRGYEVIYMYDPMDEYVMSHLTEYEDKQLINASKEDLKLDKTKDEKDKDKSIKKEFEPVIKFWEKLVTGSAISSVKISQRLSTTPAIAVASKYGSSAYMEKLMKSQALKDSGNFIPQMQNPKILEINVDHPLIKAIKDRVVKVIGSDYDKNIDKIDQKTKTMALLVTDSAVLEGGFEPDSKLMNERIRLVLKDYIGSKNDFEVREPEAPSPAKVSDEL